MTPVTLEVSADYKNQISECSDQDNVGYSKIEVDCWTQSVATSSLFFVEIVKRQMRNLANHRRVRKISGVFELRAPTAL